MPKPSFSPEAIEAQWDALADLDQAAAIELATRFQQQQPAAMMFLLAMDDSIDDPSRKGQMLELGLLVFVLFDGVKPAVATITPEVLDALDDANIQKAEDPTLFTSQLETYNQRDLLAFLIELLSVENDEELEKFNGDIALQMISLKTVIDAFDR